MFLRIIGASTMCLRIIDDVSWLRCFFGSSAMFLRIIGASTMFLRIIDDASWPCACHLGSSVMFLRIIRDVSRLDVCSHRIVYTGAGEQHI